MANPDVQGQPPGTTANVGVTEVSPSAAQARMIADAMKEKAADNRVADIKLAIVGFAAVLASLAAGYLLLDNKISKLADKIETINISNTKIETKLDDLLQRIPPVQAPAKR